MARIDAAYDYFLSTYGKDLGSRYQTHKKSELRSTYNSILKTNKMAPLYKLSDTGDVAKFAIDIKEQANQVSTSIYALDSNGGDIASIQNQKVAQSSDEESIGAKYVGMDNDAADAPAFTMEVKRLASPQVNQGNFLNPLTSDFEQGTHSFDLDTRTNSYEFQFNVNPGDTNHDIQQKVARLVNSADVGLEAEVIYNDKKQSALKISSKATGLGEDEEWLFKIQSNTSWNEINKLGINKVSSEAANSIFTLNGSEHSSLSNSFTVNKVFEVSMNQVTDAPVTIGFKADTDAVADGVQKLLDSYNGMVSVGIKYSNAHNNNILYNEVTKIGSGMSESLKEVGILSDPDGYLFMDRDVMAEAITSDKSEQAFNTLNKFKNAMGREATKASLNPMNYVNKVIVEYKNPEKALAFPYAPSAYAGLLVDQHL